ncbi:MAG TPA: hypothetical protein VGM20_09940 [Gemmatimonadales bacterium]
MSGLRTVGDKLRARVQLAIGAAARLGDEVHGAPGLRVFEAADRNGGAAMIVSVHQAPPVGPTPAALSERLTRLGALEHPALELPLSCGAVDGMAWTLETASALPTARDRVVRSPLPLSEGVAAVRDLGRAIVAMHRAGLTHGAIGLDTVQWNPDGVKLGGAALSMGVSVRDDLDALAQLAWTLFSGQMRTPGSPRLSAIRRRVPPRLDDLCVAMFAADPAARPQSAEEILDVLDVIPTRRTSEFPAMLDAGFFDSRPRRQAPWLMVGIAVAALAAILFITRT